jgi:hypothetical protein
MGIKDCTVDIHTVDTLDQFMLFEVSRLQRIW